MFVPSKVILHCSATPDYPEPSAKYDLFGASDIDVWHKKRGWSGIGYHVVVRRTGLIETGRPLTKVGAHTKGYNHDSIGVCYIGTKNPTPQQVKSLLDLFVKFRGLCNISADMWFGHHEFNAGKTCPGIHMDIFRKMLLYYGEVV